jgi:hypothetical protein
VSEESSNLALRKRRWLRLLAFPLLVVPCLIAANRAGVWVAEYVSDNHGEQPTPDVVPPANGNVEGNAATVVLRPEEWIGQPCPLIPQTDIGSRLQRGEWVVLLHRAGCDVCREMMPRYLMRAADGKERPTGPGWALIEVLGDGDSAAESWVAPGLLSGRLNETKRWVVQTPVILHLEDGVVTQVAHTLEEVQE